jgi:rhodanese-related sulfurtransferase
VPVPRITKEDLKQRLDSGTPLIVIDARLKYPYEHSTVKLPGAIRVGDNASAPPFPQDREIVVYDSDPNELASSDVAAELIRRGYRAVTLKGGIAEWVDAKMPTEMKEAPKQATPEPGALKG